MPRHPRFNLAGVPQHIVQRGHNRQPTFIDDADYRRYLVTLGSAARAHACDVHAYVLMPNHVHLLVTPRRSAGVSGLMQWLSGRYAQYVNIAHGRSGSLWEGRYRASLVDSEHYLLACYRYIELNPVRAGLVGDPGAYPWSSPWPQRRRRGRQPDRRTSALWCARRQRGRAPGGLSRALRGRDWRDGPGQTRQTRRKSGSCAPSAWP